MGLRPHRRRRSAVIARAAILAGLVAPGLVAPGLFAPGLFAPGPLGAAAAPTASDGDPLSVCFQSSDPPLSNRRGNGPEGFAVALSRVIAKHLGRDLRVQWFVSRDDADADLIKDANALLSDGRCELMAEYPLGVDTLGRPVAPVVKLPPFEGAGPDDRGRWVKVGELVATQPYRLDALTIVLPGRETARHVSKLSDLAGQRVGVEIATLADAIAMHYAGGRLIEHVVHETSADQLFGGLEKGELDAALVSLREFDAWRLRHDADGLTATGYVHSIGFNMGFAGLATESKLIDEVNAVLAELRDSDALPSLARAAGLTYEPPRSPAVQPRVGPAALVGD